MESNSSIEYQALTVLYDTIQTGIQSGIDDVVGKAFSKGLIPPHVKSVAGNTSSTLSQGNRTAHLLDAVLSRTKIHPDTFDDFIWVLKQVTAFHFLVEKMQDTKSELLQKQELKEQDLKEIKETPTQKIKDLRLPNLTRADRNQQSNMRAETSQSDLSTPVTQVHRGHRDDPPTSLQALYGIESPLQRFPQFGTPGLTPYSANLFSKSIFMDSSLVGSITSTSVTTPVLKMGIPKGTDCLWKTVTQINGVTTNGDTHEHMASVNELVAENDQEDHHPQPDGMVSNPTSRTLDLSSPHDSHHPPTQIPLPPSDASSSLTMPTATTNKEQTEATPTIQTTLPTPLTPPSVDCSSLEANGENSQLCPNFLMPCRERSNSTSSLFSTQSSLNSLDFFSACSSLESSDSHFTFVPQTQAERSDHHEDEQSIARTQSFERLVDLKAQNEEVTKQLASLEIKNYTQQLVHANQERHRLNELQTVNKEKFELQNDLKNIVDQYAHLYISLGQLQNYISQLEAQIVELNKRCDDMHRDLIDVKVDAYDKGREINSLKQQVRNCESQLECLRRLHC